MFQLLWSMDPWRWCCCQMITTLEPCSETCILCALAYIYF
jgi:hypothetical protein